jgi:dipeptidyl aminopeptidase/acylaminoacyl peptidase
MSGAVTRKIQLASLDGATPKTLFDAETGPIVAGGYYLYVRDLPVSRLMAQAFNPSTFEPEGRPAAVTDDNVDFHWYFGDPRASASANVLIYTTGKLTTTQLTWFSRTGRPLSTVGDPGVYYDPTISPDGTTLAVERADTERGASDLWTIDLARNASSRLTAAPGFESVAVWTPDGRQIIYGADPGSGPKMWIRNASGTGTEEVLLPHRAYPTDISPNGKLLLFLVVGSTTQRDIWIYDFEHKTSSPLLDSPFEESTAKFSPDGKWIAYVSDEAQRPEVYIRSFPDGATKIRVSADGGDEPEWRRDGKELFYLAPDSTLMAVEIRQDSKTLTLGAVAPLFVTNVERQRVIRNNYTASPDGQRILVMSPLVHPSASPLVGMLNWAAGLSSKR